VTLRNRWTPRPFGLVAALAAALSSIVLTPTLAKLNTAAPPSADMNREARSPSLLMPPWGARKVYRGKRHKAKPTSGVIDNVVVIVMENRSLDNLFAGYWGMKFNSTDYWQDVVDIANPSAYGLQEVGLATIGSPSHSHSSGFATECNSMGTDTCHYNNWQNENVKCGKTTCNTSALSYVNPVETAIYGQLVQKFGFADEVQQANQGPSFPGHQYLIAGQAGGIAEPGSSYAPLAMVENSSIGAENLIAASLRNQGDDDRDPYDARQKGGFCNNVKATVSVLNMTLDYETALTQEPYLEPEEPCQNYPTIFDTLTSQISPYFFAWEYHAQEPFGYWSAPMAIQHFASYMGTGKPIPSFIVDPNAYTFITNEAPSGNLAAVTYLIPCPSESDHPDETTNDGPRWVATLLNAIGANTSLWNRTAVFIVWDDWGGWFDHDPALFSPLNVYPAGSGPPPNPSDPYEWGFRVPLIVVSPYVKQSGYVSHLSRSYSAILNFIEWNWRLQSLNADDYANNLYAQAHNELGGDNLTDLFDFTRQPMPYGTPIPVGTYRPTPECK
jgi:phospholipase C